MRFRDTVSLDEAEVLAGRFKSVSARYYVLHDPEKLTDKYVTAWSNLESMLARLVYRATLEQLQRGMLGKMRCNFCGLNLTKDEEEFEVDSKGLNYGILQACSNNSSNTVNTIEYLLMRLDCK